MNKRLAVALVGFFLFYLWIEASKLWSYSLALPILFWVLITRNGYSYAKAKKICLANCYFEKRSLFYYLWTRKIYIFLVSFFVGTLLTSILVFASLQFTVMEIIVLLLDSFFLVFFYTILSKNGTLKERVKGPILKNISAWLGATIVVIVLFVSAYHQTPPEYLRPDLIATLSEIEKEHYSNSAEIDLLAYIVSSVVAIKWWILTQATLAFGENYLVKFFWLLQLFGNYLMAFAYGRYLLELVDLVPTESDRRSQEETNE